MIHRTQDGGQAFPHGGNESEDAKLGMTLRDWFAGQALIGLLGGRGGPLQKQFTNAGAVLAYEYADEMIEARK